jgi:malate dehydrogenase (oxaloacetate-decarboxylating)(NADP+)
MALAGVYSSTRITGIRFRDLRIMFLGAGSAATGIADLMTAIFASGGPFAPVPYGSSVVAASPG